ncbi:hypothetical protein FGB62_308g09 [Gracilaria domingensis]|nr:hypothetical protein FGB62_308g09 [Gracilaria domingensis]
MLADLLHFLDQRQIEQATVTGHSMGGKLAMHLALPHPHLVSELIDVDIAPIQYRPTNDPSDSLPASRAMLNVDLSSVETREDVDRQLSANCLTSDAVRNFLMTNLTSERNAATKYRWRVNLNAIYPSMPSIMAFPQQDGPRCK